MTALASLKKCHTKTQWLLFFKNFHNEILFDKNGRLIKSISLRLRAEKNSYYFGSQIFETLLEACDQNGHIKLGLEIWEAYPKLSNAKFNLLAINIYIKACEPNHARLLALKTLRLRNLTFEQKSELEVAICQSYAEQGRANHAIKRLSHILSSDYMPKLTMEYRARVMARLAATFFYVGECQTAATLYEQSAKFFLESKQYFEATRANFNCASALYNIEATQSLAFIEKAQSLATRNDYSEILGHIDAFYALAYFQKGDFDKAIRTAKNGLENQQKTQINYLSVHLMSTLALVLVAKGMTGEAKQKIQKVLSLSKADHSYRWTARYSQLKAQLDWIEGKLPESLSVLKASCQNFQSNASLGLEERTVYNQYLQANAILGNSTMLAQPDWSKLVKLNSYAEMDYKLAQMEILLSKRDFQTMDEKLQEALSKIDRATMKYQFAKLLIIQAQLALNTYESIDRLKNQIEIARSGVRALGTSNLEAKVRLLKAAYYYRKGKVKATRHFLVSCSHLSNVDAADKLFISAALNIINGKSPKLTQPWKQQHFARQLRIFFGPTVEFFPTSILFSDHYAVNMAKSPTLLKLIHFLLQQPQLKASIKSIQEQVWSQSHLSIGWEQKVRNSIGRLRKLTRFSMAPLIGQNAGYIQINKEYFSAFTVSAFNTTELDEKILTLIDNKHIKSEAIAKQAQISKPTAIRTLKRMRKEEKVKMIKKGREVFYIRAYQA